MTIDLFELIAEGETDKRGLAAAALVADANRTSWKVDYPNAEEIGNKAFYTLLEQERALKEQRAVEAARSKGNYGLRNTQFPVGVFDSSYLAKPHVSVPVPGKKN